MHLSRFFIDRPIFAAVLSIVIFIAGADRDVRAADQRVPRRRAAVGRRPRRSTRAPTPGRSPRRSPRRSRSRSTASRTCSTCRRRGRRDGVLTLTVTFRVGTDVDLAQVQVQNRVSQALPRLPEEVRQLGVTTVKSSPNFTWWCTWSRPTTATTPSYLRNYALLQVKDVLGAHPGRRARSRCSARGDYAMRVWLDPGQGGGPRPDRRRRGERHPRAERAGRRRRGRRARRCRAGGLPAHRQRPGPPDSTRSSSATSSSRPAPTARSRGSATWRASSSAAGDYALRSHAGQPGRGGASASSRRRGRTRSSSPPPCAKTMEELKKNFPEGVRVPRSSTTRPSTCATASARSSRRCSRRSCWW